MPLVPTGSFAESQSCSDNSRILSETDIERLKRCRYLNIASPQQRALLEELEAMAVFVDSADVPADVITLNTTLECVNVGGDVYRWTLVYPDKADYQRGRISVLSPAGIALLAGSAHLASLSIASPANNAEGAYSASWVLVSSNVDFLGQRAVIENAIPIPKVAGIRAWTDDYSSLLPLLKF